MQKDTSSNFDNNKKDNDKKAVCLDSVLRIFKKNWRSILVFGNITVVVIMILMCALYVKHLHKIEENKVQKTFFTAVSSMQKVSSGYLFGQQASCNDWAAYINAGKMSMDEAIEYVKNVNSVKGVMGHIIDYYTLQGYSSIPDEAGNNKVDYAAYKADFNRVFSAVQNEKIVANITRTYINEINSLNVIGFCQDVSILEKDGALKHYLLIRTVPLSIISAQWIFPADYEKAEMSLITLDGNYIVRSKSLKNDNFWEFLKNNNNFTYQDKKDLIKEYYTGNNQIRELKNSEGQDSYFVCLQSVNNKDLFYVGYVPKNSVVDEKVDFAMVIIVILGSFLLMVIDVGYILYVNKRLASSVEETMQANQAKTRFLSSMSHDIRTPMNAIMGMTTIATKKIDDKEQVKDCLEKITLASKHLLTLINDILDISKIESGKMSLNPGVFSLSESVTNLVNIVRPQIKEKDLIFNVYINKIEYEYLYADELRMNQIFINLLSNAVKYTDPGGSVTLRMDQALHPKDSGRVVLTYIVEDTGIGMSEEYMKNMYKTFSRAVDTRIDKIQGSGLGLAITKQMVDLMGGSIECKSKIGEGTKFTVKLELPIANRGTDDLTLPNISVLCVDDDEIFLKTAEYTLTSMGVNVDLADSGAKAVEMVCEQHAKGKDYPAIILDWKMPGMNGIETTKAIRDKVGDAVPIIIISAYDWTDIEDEAVGAGVNGFINKPLFKSDVYTKMNELLHFDTDSAAEKSNGMSELEGINILVAEDNDLNWEIIQEILSFNKIKSTRAKNGKDCIDILEQAKSDEYDLVLMDIQMPVMNGYEATAGIRGMKQENKRNIPIIAMTADAFAEDVQECLNAGMNSHVSKPIDVEKLFKEIKRVLHK